MPKRKKPAAQKSVLEYFGSAPTTVSDNSNKRLNVGAAETMSEVGEETAASVSECSSSQNSTEKESACLITTTQEKNKYSESNEHMSWPAVWSEKQIKEFQSKYPWLCAKDQKLGCSICRDAGPLRQKHMHISNEWAKFEVNSLAEGRKEVLSSLRVKIKRHLDSEAHTAAAEQMRTKQLETIQTHVLKAQDESIKLTEKVFRTVYYLAKNNRPFSDHENLIQLQKLNGIELGIILHSRHSATSIADHIAKSMRQRICQGIVKNNCKFAVLVDESTTSGADAVLTVHLKATCHDLNSPPEFVFLGLLKLSSQTAKAISDALLAFLKQYFGNDSLEENWIAYVSDGASVMLGRKTGVAANLLQQYPKLFIWHCANHRLELSVHDAITQVTSINHFKSFMDALYALYSQSTKNSREFEEACSDLNEQFLKIRRILDMRWVASSFRTVRAVWQSFPGLCSHFTKAASDQKRAPSERARFEGLLATLASPEFLENLAVMHDVLSELSLLSLQFQSEAMTIPKANDAIKRTIRVLISMKETPGGIMETVSEAATNLKHRSIPLESNKAIRPIIHSQFIQAVVDSMNHRMNSSIFDNGSILDDLKIFGKTTWPSSNIRYGEMEIKRLCTKFRLETNAAILGMRELLDGEGTTENLQPLMRAVATIPCSTAICERSFSAMNLICSDIRSSLSIDNISNLLFISVNGPPIQLFNPNAYVVSWMEKHRLADCNKSKKCKEVQPKLCSFWQVL